MTHAVALELKVSDADAADARRAYPELTVGAAICAYAQAKLRKAGMACEIQGVIYAAPK